LTVDARWSVAGGSAPAVEGSAMPCRVMELSSGLWQLHRAVRAAASSARTSR
jgi:hypothetical protein